MYDRPSPVLMSETQGKRIATWEEHIVCTQPTKDTKTAAYFKFHMDPNNHTIDIYVTSSDNVTPLGTHRILYTIENGRMRYTDLDPNSVNDRVANIHIVSRDQYDELTDHKETVLLPFSIDPPPPPSILRRTN